MNNGNKEERWALLLSEAISLGDVNKAKEFASYLATDKARVQVCLQGDEVLPAPERYEIKVHIEDKNSSGAVLPIFITPTTKMRDLKAKLNKDHNFPQEIQRWIYGKKLLNDDDILYRKGVTSSREPVHLYLLSMNSPLAAAGAGSNQSLPRTTDSAYVSMHSPGEEVHVASAGRTHLTESVYMSMHGRGADGDYLQTNERTQMQNHLLGSVNQAEPIYESLSSIPNYIAPPPPKPPKPPALRQKPQVGWKCPACTFINQPTRPGCEICATDRPADYQLPANVFEVISLEEQRRLAREERLTIMVEQETKREEETRTQNWLKLLQTSEIESLVSNVEPFQCTICFDDVETGQGVCLRECLHHFCKECLSGCIENSQEAAVTCPFKDNNYSCNASITDREIKQLVPESEYRKYLERGLAQAESAAVNSFHCKTVNCPGWCIYEDNVNFFYCDVCDKKNCLTCKAIHVGQNCKQFQEDLRIKAANDRDAQETQRQMDSLLSHGEAMKCPQCNILIMKKDGCDWICCTMCKTEICWVTKGRRWGPKGTGDTSGGCKCNVNSKKCHPRCQNCH